MSDIDILLTLYKKKREGKLIEKERLEYERRIAMQCFDKKVIEAILEKMIKEEGLT